MKTASEIGRTVVATVVAVICVLAMWALALYGSLYLFAAVIPFTGLLAVVLMLVGGVLVQDLLLDKPLGKAAEIVFDLVFYAFGLNFELWDSDRVKTVDPIKQGPPEPQAA